MYSQTEVDRVLELAAGGFSHRAIARLTGVSRATVRNWVAGALPRRADDTLRVPAGPYAYLRYQFSNRSEDSKALLCEHLDLLGIAWRRANAVNISIARREAVAALDAFVGPKR